MSTNTNKFSTDFLIGSVPFIQDIKSVAEKYGVRLYLVGGSIRDMLMGQSVKDVDIVPFGIGYEEFAKHLAKNIKAPAVAFKDNMRIMKRDIVIDVSKPRGVDIHQDLLQRDFTINNLACDMEGNIIGDSENIYDGIVKPVHDRIFDDDPLRILRAFRFKSVLGFNFDKSMEALIDDKMSLITLSAKERILEELRKTFYGEYFSNVVWDERFISVWNNIAANCTLNHETATRAKLYEKDTPEIFSVFLALFVEGKGAEKFFKQFPLSVKELKTVGNLLKIENRIDFQELETEINRQRVAWQILPQLKTITSFLKSKYPQHIEVLELVEKSSLTLNSHNAGLITGNDLKDMGFPPSPIFAQILKDAKEQLALNLIEPENIKGYIKEKYKL